jgi:hypothetical protein
MIPDKRSGALFFKKLQVRSLRNDEQCHPALKKNTDTFGSLSCPQIIVYEDFWQHFCSKPPNRRCFFTDKTGKKS